MALFSIVILITSIITYLSLGRITTQIRTTAAHWKRPHSNHSHTLEYRLSTTSVTSRHNILGDSVIIKLTEAASVLSRRSYNFKLIYNWFISYLNRGIAKATLVHGNHVFTDQGSFHATAFAW